MVENAGNGQAPGQRAAAAPREIHLRDLWAVVVRHWRIVALVTLLVSGGAWISGRGAVSRYQSQLTVQVNSPKQVFARTDDIDIDELALRTDPILSEALVLTTQALALRVVDQLELQLEIGDPEVHREHVLVGIMVEPGAPLGSFEIVQHAPEEGFELRYPDGTVIATGSYYERVAGPGFSLEVLPPENGPRTVQFSVIPPEQAAAWVRAGLGYRVRSGTNAVDITFTGSDQTLVPLVLNQAALELREDGAVRARVSAARRRQYIADQLARAEAAAVEKRAEVQRYKETERITDLTSEEQSIVRTISESERERQRIQVRISTLQDAVGTEADTFGVEALNRLAAVEGTENNAVLSFQIRRLLELYEERHSATAGALGLREGNPQVQAIDQRIESSHRSLSAAVSAALDGLRGRDQAARTEIAALRRQLMSYPGKESQIAQLQLEASILEDTYRYLLAQFQQARMQEMTITPYVVILDGASPSFAIGTNLRQKILLGIMVGLLLGLGAAFFLEYLDQTIKSVADIERSVGTPVLGRIPLESKLTGANGRRGQIVVLSQLDQDDPAVEAFRALRTNVTFVGAERPVQFITLTSPGPGEGKSTTAVNLALVLAQGGSKTLLIDGDLRRSQVHRAFGLVQEPGLTDVLIGEAGLREATRPEVVANLDVLPSGQSPPNPAELLGSDAMRRMVSDLRRDYEYIVMDTPPSLPVTDAAVVASVSDATILVLRSGETEESAAQRAVEQLRQVRARIAGAVLNGVTRRRDRYYSYYSSDRSSLRRRGMAKSLRMRIVGML
jgi:tyrosine-protein kinase Etk/Wzc